jgi:predicted TPR repeat methyltransferase
VLVERLGYRGPELVGEALARAGLAPGAGLDVLDAGCGTGLGAVQLRPLARRLVGVDLSGEMLRCAASRGYDELVEADLIEHAAKASAAFDLVTATEVLLYFGELEAPLLALASTLRSGGLLVLTVEAASPEVARWGLGPSGRYAHARDYLHTALEGAGLVLVALESVVLRRELGAEVRGWLASARRDTPSTAAPVRRD